MADDRGNLVLTRKVDEDITLIVDGGGVSVTIRIAEIQRGQVKLLINAPQNVRIYRSELLEAQNDTCLNPTP